MHALLTLKAHNFKRNVIETGLIHFRDQLDQIIHVTRILNFSIFGQRVHHQLFEKKGFFKLFSLIFQALY